MRRESGYYPPGAEFDPNAPYNQKDPEERTCEKHVAVTLEKKDVKIQVWEGCDEDWEESYNESCHTIPELLGLLGSYVRKEMDKLPKEQKGKRLRYRELIGECEGWEQTYFEVM